MESKQIPDGNSNFELVELRKVVGGEHTTPHCKKHGAMLCVNRNEKDGMWRCIRAISLKTGKCVEDCRAGCIAL